MTSAPNQSRPSARSAGSERQPLYARIKETLRTQILDGRYAPHDRMPSEHELIARATDDAGNVQPLQQSWNHHGLENNAVQRVPVVVRSVS